jgi:predicted DCC family thiol-disulfide oxidoreductase YuxK
VRDGADEADAPVLLFDGVCTLCNGSVRWLIAHDKRRVLRFAALESAAAARLLAAVGASGDGLDSVVLLAGERVWTRSAAAIEVLCRLGFPWSLAAVARILPRPIRDALYDVVARHRYAWFGREEQCLLPTPELKARFLE